MILTPRDWQATAQREASELLGTPDGAAKLAEAKRYGALADVMEQQHRDIERLRAAPVAIMDTRTALGLCAPTEADFPALYALQGHRVALVDLGPVVRQCACSLRTRLVGDGCAVCNPTLRRMADGLR